MTQVNILDIPMVPSHNGASASSIREYLKLLLNHLWMQGEGFSGKRPFGSSGWEYELYEALLKAGLVDGEFDEDGGIDYVDSKTAHHLIFTAINDLN